MLKKNRVLIVFVIVSVIALVFVGCNSNKNTDDKEAGNNVQDTVGAFNNGVHQGEAKGFKDVIKLEVEVKDGKIADIRVLQNNDTPGFGDRAAEEIIAAIKESQSTDVDTVSGATGSSTAIIKAVKIALGLEQPEVVETPKTIEPMTFEDGKFIGVAKGFKDDIKLLIEVEDSKIKSIDVLEQSETVSIGDKGIDETIALVINHQSTEVDAIAGATVSSKATVQAIKNAFEAGPASEEDLAGNDNEAAAPEQPVQQPEQPAQQPTQPAQPAQPTQPAEPAKGAYKDGTYTGTTTDGFYDDPITVTITVQGGNITDVKITHNETPEFGGDVIKKIIEAVKTKQSADIDAMSGATLTYNATMKVVRDLLNSAK